MINLFFQRSLITKLIDFSVWNLFLDPVSGDDPISDLKEYVFIEDVINDSKFGFTCDNVDGQLGFINLPHIPKSQDYAAIDKREIKILQADRYNDYLQSKDTSLHGIFQDSSCGTLATNQTFGQVAFAGSFDDDACLAINDENVEDENGDVWDIKRLVKILKHIRNK